MTQNSNLFCLTETEQPNDFSFSYSVHQEIQARHPPPPEVLEKVMELPPESDATYKPRLNMLLWYLDELMPYAVGNDQWGTKQRFHQMMTSTVMINGKPKPRVSAKAEAMLHVIYKNCYRKWVFVIPKIIANPDWRMPKY